MIIAGAPKTTETRGSFERDCRILMFWSLGPCNSGTLGLGLHGDEMRVA